jgi:hypothetical protein
MIPIIVYPGYWRNNHLNSNRNTPWYQGYFPTVNTGMISREEAHFQNSSGISVAEKVQPDWKVIRMKTLLPAARQLIRREQAENYLLILMISFAFSVSATRTFLHLTGYPRIGGGELHFAHVLWGGLILFISAVLPLIFSNQWLLKASAAGSGIGIGLFIDEVGKFITINNDYFYPPAAPVVYIFFLLVVLVYVRTKRPVVHDPRSLLYQTFDELHEVLDNDLEPNEKARIMDHLNEVISTSDRPDLLRLAENLKDFLEHEDLYLAAERPPALYLRLKKTVDRWISPVHAQSILVGGLAAWSFWVLFDFLRVFSNISDSIHLIEVLRPLVEGKFIRGTVSIDLYLILIGLQAGTGIFLAVCAVWLAFNRKKWIPRLLNSIYFMLLVSLTILTPLLFYFDQFSSIIPALVQFCLLLMTIKYISLLDRT